MVWFFIILASNQIQSHNLRISAILAWFITKQLSLTRHPKPAIVVGCDHWAAFWVHFKDKRCCQRAHSLCVNTCMLLLLLLLLLGIWISWILQTTVQVTIVTVLPGTHGNFTGGCGVIIIHGTVEALINGHPQDMKKVSVTGTGCLRWIVLIHGY